MFFWNFSKIDNMSKYCVHHWRLLLIVTIYLLVYFGAIESSSLPPSTSPRQPSFSPSTFKPSTKRPTFSPTKETPPPTYDPTFEPTHEPSYEPTSSAPSFLVSNQFTNPGTYNASKALKIPAGIYSVFVTVAGASGGQDYPNTLSACGGVGALVTANLAVRPGDELIIIVGGQGTDRTYPGNFYYNGGYNNVNSKSGKSEGAGGGGASEIRNSTGTKLVIAGGGGGGYLATSCGTQYSTGGSGGQPNGAPPLPGCSLCTGGYLPTGGNQTSGGTGGFSKCNPNYKGTNGVVGFGGNGDTLRGQGGGGGGGYYGGGGGAGTGGAGGSSYCNSMVCSSVSYSLNLAYGCNSITYTDSSGTCTGCELNGYVYIDYSAGPTSQPSRQPSRQPFRHPSSQPARVPTRQPSRQPFRHPTSQPTRRPSSQPSMQPICRPSPQPSRLPSSQPTTTPTLGPSQPTRRPSRQPSSQPSTRPSLQPSRQPLARPTNQPTSQPHRTPSSQPFRYPSIQPSIQPSLQPSQPTAQPSSCPSSQPGYHPSRAPSRQPLKQPSRNPSNIPSKQPFDRPTALPALFPSRQPSRLPSDQPSLNPSFQPVLSPSTSPTFTPTTSPTDQPVDFPTRKPSHFPTAQPSRKPSNQPSINPTNQPRCYPTAKPLTLPSKQPSDQPLNVPTTTPTFSPSTKPTEQPSRQPSLQPREIPSSQPLRLPTSQPSIVPTKQPHERPSEQPFISPSRQPSRQPHSDPSRIPSSKPSKQPSKQPSLQPLTRPSSKPSKQPSRKPSHSPSRRPSNQPSSQPVLLPSYQPTVVPTMQPLRHPSCRPSNQPSLQPSKQPRRTPTSQPIYDPTAQPIRRPSRRPSQSPSSQPTVRPIKNPSRQPSGRPSKQPVEHPSRQPLKKPSAFPTDVPSMQPVRFPSRQPQSSPSRQPSTQPTATPNRVPTTSPSLQPLACPTQIPSEIPSSQPSLHPTAQPSIKPTDCPSRRPTRQPTHQPSTQPTTQPRNTPSQQPSCQPTEQPHCRPSLQPTFCPSIQPLLEPSRQPLSVPSVQPVCRPSAQPILKPSKQPSRQPSRKPSVLPSKNPSIRPSLSPSFQPIVRPSHQPTKSPSSQPTSLPSCQPKRRPSSAPTFYPSKQPTKHPFRQPSSQPTLQPYSRPTFLPSKQPSAIPSQQPSSQPIPRPYSRPSKQPSRSPSHQPTIAPSMQPSKQPSNQPTRRPSDHPTAIPSSRPTIDGLKCSHKTFYQPANNSCLECPLHSKYNPMNRLTCACLPGYSQSGFANTLRCTLCSAGLYAENSSVSCLACPPGSFSKVAGSGSYELCPAGYYAPSFGSTGCLPCPIGFFNALLGQSVCSSCSGGQITPGVASVSVEFCLSPLPNFTMGFIALAFVMLISMKYIFHGNFNRTAFLRRERYVTPMAKLCKSTNDVLREKIRQQPAKKSTLRPRVKAVLFLIFSVVFICLYVAVFFVGLLYHIVFTSMILWRSVAFSFKLPPLLDIISNAFGSLAHSLGIPVEYFGYLLYPGLFLIRFLSTFQLNLSSLNVTCNGAKAPIELFIDLFILTVYIIFVKAEYFLLWSVSFKGLNLSYITSNVIKGKVFRSFSALSCVIVMGLFAMNPLQSMLRYSLTFASIYSFVANNGMHALSPACDNVSGAPNFDSILGISATIMAWLLALPVIYMLSEVIVPGRIWTGEESPYIAEESEESFHNAAQNANDSRPAHSVTDAREATDKNLVPVHVAKMGIFKYLTDSFLVLVSFDVWILTGFASLWVKYLHKINNSNTKKLQRRVTSASVAESISSFQRKAEITHSDREISFDQIIASFQFYAVTSAEKDSELSSQWESVKLTQLPPYAQLCERVRIELHDIIKRRNLPLPSTSVSLLLATIGLGHFLTREGRRCWAAVFRKYLVFLQVCFGIWTEEAFEAFEVERISQLMLTAEEDEGITLLLEFIVGPRALLFQVVQYGALLSAFVLSSSVAPLMVFSQKLLEKNFPEMIFSIERARQLATSREIRQRSGLNVEYFQDYKWIIHLRALVIIATESRACMFTVRMIVLTIIFIVLFASSAIDVIVLLLLVLIPYAVANSLLFIVYFGKSIDMQDSDFIELFGLLSPFPRKKKIPVTTALIVNRQKLDHMVKDLPLQLSNNDGSDSSDVDSFEEKCSEISEISERDGFRSPSNVKVMVTSNSFDEFSVSIDSHIESSSDDGSSIYNSLDSRESISNED